LQANPDVGIKALGLLYPNVKKALGGVFATLFVAFRVLFWPYLSYFFWLDCLALLDEVAPLDLNP